MFGKRGGAVVLAAVLSSGCATTTLQTYVGRDLNEVVRRYGPPAERIAMPTGGYAFKWVLSASGTPAASKPLDMFMPVSVAPMHQRRIYDKAGFLMGGMCVYTVYAKWRAESRQWFVTGYRTPRIDCA